MIRDYNNPTYWRILHTIDFHIPRRKYPNTIAEREKEIITTAETNRWKQARDFCPYWYQNHTTNFLDELDRLVLLSKYGIEERNAPIARIDPSTPNQNSKFYTHQTIAIAGVKPPLRTTNITVIFDDGDWDLITDWEVTPTDNDYDYTPYHRPIFLGCGRHGGIDYHAKYPTATLALALKNVQIESPI